MTETELLKYHKRVLTISHKSHIQYRPAFGHYISIPSIFHHLKTVPLIELSQYLDNLNKFHIIHMLYIFYHSLFI